MPVWSTGDSMVTSEPKLVSRLWNQFQTSGIVTRKVENTKQSNGICTGLLLSIKRTKSRISFEWLAVIHQTKLFSSNLHLKRKRNSLSSFYVTKIDRFGGKEILVKDGIVMGNHILLYVFNADTVNSQCYRDDVLGAYVRSFWVL
ncbi:hypothetical protein TNCV_4910181 [Trichonephila clavipes]|nr:hypothetical protein TNCV_4910181 [Trichonephila clavipes]